MKGPYTRPAVNDARNYSFAQWYRTDNGVKFRQPLPYYARQIQRTAESGKPFSAGISQLADALISRNGSHQVTCKYSHALNDAYAEFAKRVQNPSSWGTNLAEYAQTARLMSTVVGALRSPLKVFAKAAQRYSRRGFDPMIRDVADVWLAWHFGAEPLYKDLHNSFELLTKPIPPSRYLHGVGRASTSYRYTPNGRLFADISVKLIGRVGGFVTVTNPNVFLANGLGVTNPASIAWDLVPFSFLINWVYDVSGYLNSFTDFLGAGLSGCYYTQYGVGVSNEQEGKFSFASYQGFMMNRSHGLYRPVPALRVPNFGLSRTATLLALATQRIPRINSAHMQDTV